MAVFPASDIGVLGGLNVGENGNSDGQRTVSLH